MDNIIGTGATLCYPSDQYPYTIIGEEYDKNGALRYLVVQEDIAQSKALSPRSTNGAVVEEDEKFFYRRNLQGRVLILRWNKKKERWLDKRGLPYAIGTRRFYQAPEV